MIGIIHFKMGNVASVQNAFSYINKEAKIINSPLEIKDCSHLVVPGVGAFSEAMSSMRSLDLAEVLIDRAKAGVSILGICLGMQILASVGDEGGQTAGLNLIPGRVVRFNFKNPYVPHIGWNNISIKNHCPILDENNGLDFYFVHSYHFVPNDPKVIAAACDYGIEFAAVVQKENIFGLQFHPEKSFKAGLSILEKFAEL